ncbi:hypothetical protein CKO28_26495 [Rhodovibrio sodomensis]|uniref:Fe/B12 periplasmic-binding domain-containing protein n=1 Tax=Rhodovibrio sodomensis TaxID=1088 RepID=A0ABS1DN69_9PROT|nr:ABC transporter substrate-binding protein [Rhodovibrio sodomensis]MBK1671552.1 hypothetical protein [Rhodovibrio sodomensis]
MLAFMRALGTWLAPVCLIVGLAPSALASDDARVVSVGGSVTEIVYALGAEERLVGVDSTSLYPPAAQEVPDVGYMRRLSAEPILSLEPDIVLAAADAGPPEALAQLRAAGVEVVEVPDTPSPAGVTEKVRAVAAALGMAGQGEALAKGSGGLRR